MRESQHALEHALLELIGGRNPPDQTFKILAAVHRARQSAAPKRQLTRRRSWPFGTALGAAAALLVWLSSGQEDTPAGVPPQLAVQVLDGTLEWRALTATRSAVSGDGFLVTPRIGDHLIASPVMETRARLGDLGTLIMTPGTQLEIADMKWQEFGIGFGSGSLSVAVIVGSFTWLSGGANHEAAPGDQLVLEPPPSLRAGVSDARTETLRDELSAARAEIARLEAAAQRRAVESEPPSEPPVVDEAHRGPQFHPLELDPKVDALLGSLDWRSLCEQSVDLAGNLNRLMTLLATGEDIPQELLGELQRLKGTLHAQGGFLDEGVIPGTNFDTQARHPLIGAQWMSALLEHSDLPLDGAQRLALKDLARRYAAEDQARRAGYGEDTPLIRKYVEELEMQDRFYRDAGYLMSDAQQQLFSAGDFEGRVGAKLVGTASMAWGEWTQPVVVRNREEFASAMTTGFSNALGLDDRQQSALGALVRQWGQAFPAEWWDQPFDDLDRYGGYDVERLKVAARLQLQFFDQVVNAVGLTSEQLQILRKVRSLVVPYRRK